MKRASKRTIRIITHSGIRQDGAVHVQMDAPEPQWLVDAESKARAAHYFRVNFVGKELRACYLAYAFLRGIPLEAIEAKGREPIPFERIEWLVAKHADEDPRIWQQKYAQWRAAAWNVSKHPRPWTPRASDHEHPDSKWKFKAAERAKRAGSPFPYEAIPR